MEPPWDQVYARDVPPDFEEMRKREDRKERIKPFWDSLVNDKEPKVNKDALMRLMHDLKEEGNALFKEDHFDIAWMHYRNAICVVRMLENRFYYTVEKEFTSSLFSNRAFCCLKKSMYKEAVQDCDSAVGVYPSNIKAYYRQAQAYKHLKNYPDAYKAAVKGQKMQPSSAFKEIIDELEPLLKQGIAEVSVKDAQTILPVKANPDTDWLAGTNVTVTEKHLESKTKMSKKNKKKNKVGNQSKSVVVPEREPDTESDDSSGSPGPEDDTEFANMLTGVRKSTLHSAGPMLNGRSRSFGALDINPPQPEEEDPWSFPHDNDEDVVVENQVTKPAMGLDSFSSPEFQHSDNTESENTSISFSNPSSGRSSRASQSPNKTLAVVSRPASTNASPAPALIPQINFPLQDDFDFKMACVQCFPKIGEGVKGYRYVSATHQCARDVLIVKKRDVPGINWVKIRYRPDVKGHYGGYKVCTQFNQSKPCKVSEEKCTFPHTQVELHLWTLDRNGTFSIGTFLSLCRQYKLYDTAALAAVKSKQQYIPGLNYASGKSKKQQQPTLGITYNEEVNPAPPASLPSSQTAHTPVMRPNINQAVGQPRYAGSDSYLSHPPPPIGQQIGQYGYLPNMIPAASAPVNGMYSQPPPSRGGGQWMREVPDVLQEPDSPKPDQQLVAQLENPLADTHTALVACQFCFKPSMYPGMYEYLNIVHKCEESMLAMREFDPEAHWVRVRERKNHREFPGNYILCNSFKYKNPTFCKYGEDLCSFAHNEVEKYLWTLEKDGQFNITEFLIQNRKYAVGKGFSLKEVLSKHGGYFDFICRSCYYGQPPQISYIGPDKAKCSGIEEHKWKDFRILAHIGQNAVTVINPRGFLHKSAFFKICQWLQFCRRMVNANCKFAHSWIERDVWMVERDCEIRRDEIVNQSKQLMFGQAASGTMNSGQTTQAIRTGTTTTAAITDSKTPPSQSADPSAKPSDGLCPIVVVEICQTCWKNGQKTPQQPGKDRCQKSHGNWSCNVVYLLRPSFKELRPLPKVIPKGLNFIVCKYICEGKKCGFTGSGPCQFAHSQDELDAWKFMCMHNLKTAAELSEASKAAQKARAETAKPKISGQSVVTATPMVAKGPVMPMMSVHTFYCHYCGVSCNSQKQWDEHCASEKHNFNVNSDKEHQWNYRQPPWTSGRYYELCEKHMDGQKCKYSSVPSMYNLCAYAHGQDELDEWKERYEWRQMKREMARQERVFSYMDELLEKYEASTEPIKVISENLDGVKVSTRGDLNIYKEEKHAMHVWTFSLTALRPLQKVALLYNRDRLHFSLMNGNERSCQIAQGEVFCNNVDHQGLPMYNIQLKFVGGMFGSFQQWVLFDFGSAPVLCRKITVEVGDQLAHEKVRSLREQLQFDRWTSQNREIVRHEELEERDERLVAKYKEPSSSQLVVTTTTVTTELNQYNYKPKMHKLLELEEMTRHQIIASFNLCVKVECVQNIRESVFVYARPGELFAKVPLKESLTEDTDAGKLILTSVRKVLLAPQDNCKKVVFEAVIVREENFNYDGRGREFIYLCLSCDCVSQLNLNHGSVIDVEIQFQMDRLFFCRMHFAVDALYNTNTVFPDVSKINPFRNEKHNIKVSSSVLNQDQMAAIRHIVAERTGYTPPFVLYGPFGTGKTETLAQATMVLLKETKETRILICAQSNSAADLYIIKHLDNYLKRTGNTSLLCRVYQKERRVFTVDKEVKKYCLLDNRDGESKFRVPTRADIENCRVAVVTVTTSLALANLDLQGMFSHIFIDEAAQTLECESLMPLSLATEKTCIVLAGDHHQISPKVYSDEAMNQSFHQSLLERLFNYYDSHSNFIHVDSPLNIFLSVNYRTKMEILRFISAVCYGGPDILKSEANIRSVLSITPLVFYAVQGREVQDENIVSYYNLSEVQEIVERVDELYEKWPEEWGPAAAKEIGVVTPYHDQVIYIRKALRKRNSALKEVTVERVQGVQGKEFRAMFITTVRTRHLIESPHVRSEGLTGCNGEDGDFGFLSDVKLLNTALTRTQSAVIVVGDPVALCAIGECRKVWQTYLKHCQNMRSLFPQNYTFDSIRQQVQNLQSSPAQERLVQIANERQSGHRHVHNEPQPASDQHLAKPLEKDPAESFGLTMQNDTSSSTDPFKTTHQITPTLPNGSQMFTSNLLSAGLQNVGLGAPTNGLMPKNPLTPLNPLRIGLVRPLGQPPLNLQQMEPCYEVGEDFNIDSDLLAQVKGPENNGENGSVLPNYTEQQLVALLSDGRRYVRCILHIENGKCYAESISDRVMITVPSRLYCSKGNNKDEVVVEIVTERSQSYGKVVGVLKRAVDLTTRYIVCRKGEADHIMVPVNEGLSPMYNINLPGIQSQKMEGNVTVYRITKTKQIKFSHMETVPPTKVDSRLFSVRFLQYDGKTGLPLCVVMGVLQAEPNLAVSTKILDLNHHIVRRYNPAISEESEHQYPSTFTVTSAMMRDRHLDLRDRWCFTIDQTGEGLSSRAFSIDQVSDDSYQVGVHVADVSAFVKKNSNVDIEARRRGVSMISQQGPPVQMLPENLSTQLCCLKPMEDKLALSVLMTVKSTGELTQVNVQKTTINCKKSYSFREAEDSIHDPYAHEDYMKSCLLVLSQISGVWRKKRLGNASLYQEMINGNVTPFSQQMVEELIVTTEHHIAEIVASSFPEVTPMTIQEPPHAQVLEVWKKNHAADAVNSIALTKPFLNHTIQETCNCGLACTHTVNYVRQFNITKRDYIDVISLLWDSLNEAVGIGDYTSMQNIIVAAENHPQIAVAMKKLLEIQEDSQLVCSADVRPEECGHYYINQKTSTLFADPLGCYIDIVLQRLLVACLDKQPSPYTRQEIQTICAEGNIKLLQKKSYEKENFIIQLSSALLSRPLILNPVVVEPGAQQLQICFPTLQCISNIKQISVKSLGVNEAPVMSSEGYITMKWLERVYDMGVLQQQRLIGSSFGELNPDRFIYKIPAFLWQRLLMAVREPDEEQRKQKLSGAVAIVGKQVSNPAMGGDFIEDVTSEVQKMGNINHIAEFSLRLHSNQVLRVQLSARLENGILAPYLQLLNLTNTLDVCLQHREHPIESFISSPSNISCPVSPCTSIEGYQKQWREICEMEAVTRAVSGNDRLVVNNVYLEWSGLSPNNTFTAEMTIPIAFLKDRCIKITSKFQQDILFNPKNAAFCNAYFSDFLCVRYGNMTLPNKPGLSDSLAQIVNNRCAVTWVGHCTVMGVTASADRLKFQLELVQSDVPLPLQLVQRRACSVEFIMRAERDRMILYGLKNLENSSKLTSDIILRRTQANNSVYPDTDILLQQYRQILQVSNQQQEEALKLALSQPLTVIQGCVGSGKSVLATKLCLMYTQRNQVQEAGRQQVLVCAPTEAAVDIINDYLLSLQHGCPNVVRVYESDVENTLHPGPKDVIRPRKPSHQIKARYSPLSIYSHVRGSGSPFSKPITEFESLFSLYKDDISDEQYEEYVQLLTTAESALLQNAHIILCTCVTAAQLRISSLTNIQQIIIDDVNSGTEPEILVPLSVYTDAKQVVLLGDTNQIGPRVLNKTARALGLGRSIIKSYLTTAVYLNVQYRVHEGIIDFPSRYCYDNRVLCGTMGQRQPSILNWPGGRNKPAVFCKLDGEESCLPLDLNMDNQDKSSNINNREQADFAVRVAVALVVTYNVPVGNVAIVCATRGQCSTIAEKIATTGHTVPCFTFPEIQGLEFDYVVLSTVHDVPCVFMERYRDEKWRDERLGQLSDTSLVISVLTRARKGLVIVGNEALLRCDGMWNKLLSEYDQTNRLVTAELFLKTMSM